VTGAAIRSAGEGPGLGAGDTSGIGDRDVGAVAIRQQVGLGAICAPAVGHAIINAILPVNHKARFHAAADGGIPFVGGQVELFDEDAALGKLPRAAFGEGDLFSGGIGQAVIGQGEPALFRRPVGPKGGIDGEGNEPIAGRQAGQIGKSTDLRQQRRWLGGSARAGSGGRQFAVEKFPDRVQGIQSVGLGPDGGGEQHPQSV